MQKLRKMNTKKQSAGDLLRFWRKLSKMSQLDLALEIGISTKHLSFVETGRSQPSRNLILRLAQVLKLPLRHSNAFLNAAGYVSEFSEEPFDGQKMEILRGALHRMLEKHEPYPALVLNTSYEILMTNTGFDKVITYYLGGDIGKKFHNVYRLTFAEDGLRQYIKDWPVVENFLLSRLWEEAVTTQSHELFRLYEEITQLQTKELPLDYQIDNSLPMMSLTIEKDGVKASFFTTITTLGTPLDLTAQELRIESLFPADETTKHLFATM